MQETEFDLETFKPLDARILVQLHVVKQQLILKAEQVEPIADVLTVGPGHLLEDGHRLPTQVQPGDVVLLGNATGRNVKIKGIGNCFVIQENCIEAVVGKMHNAVAPTIKLHQLDN